MYEGCRVLVGLLLLWAARLNTAAHANALGPCPRQSKALRTSRSLVQVTSTRYEKPWTICTSEWLPMVSTRLLLQSDPLLSHLQAAQRASLHQAIGIGQCGWWLPSASSLQDCHELMGRHGLEPTVATVHVVGSLLRKPGRSRQGLQCLSEYPFLPL